MFDGMDEEVVPKKKVEEIDGPLLTERDKMKIERRKRKDERQREVTFYLIMIWFAKPFSSLFLVVVDAIRGINHGLL